jgi:hypothetical protein
MDRRNFTAALAHLVFAPKFEKWYRQSPQGIWYSDYKVGVLVNIGLRDGKWVIEPLAGRAHATEFTVLAFNKNNPTSAIIGHKNNRFEFALPYKVNRL